MNNNGSIKVRVFDMKHGLVEYEDIKIVRITSEDYNLLIMKDYTPIIGEIEGNVNLKSDTKEVDYNSIRAFYVLSDNVFNLMIKEG